MNVRLFLALEKRLTCSVYTLKRHCKSPKSRPQREETYTQRNSFRTHQRYGLYSHQNNPAISNIPITNSSAKFYLPGPRVWSGYCLAVCGHGRDWSDIDVEFLVASATTPLHARNHQALAKGGDTATDVNTIEVR